MPLSQLCSRYRLLGYFDVLGMVQSGVLRLEKLDSHKYYTPSDLIQELLHDTWTNKNFQNNIVGFCWPYDDTFCSKISLIYRYKTVTFLLCVWITASNCFTNQLYFSFQVCISNGSSNVHFFVSI